MKFFNLCALSALLLTSSVFAAKEPAKLEQQETASIAWMTDYEAAKVRAKAESKPLFLFFSGFYFLFKSLSSERIIHKSSRCIYC